MDILDFLIKKKINILALGAESAGIFAIYHDGSIFISENFGDLLNENNFAKYKKAVLDYLKIEKIKPDVILTDLHPLFKTTLLGEELAIRLGSGQAKEKHSTLDRKIVKLIRVQHHIAHIFSAVGDRILLPTTHYPLPTSFIGLAMDGTGYGLDGNIWGGETFRLQMANGKRQTAKIQRIGSLEEQIMIGGDLAVREPARMLISILSKFLSKEKVYNYVKKYYSKNEFEALYNQMEQNFNCQITTSTGRVLDAVSVLLGFAGNERNFKHEAVKKLEENSTESYDIKLKIISSVIASSPSIDGERGNPADIAINTRLLRLRQWADPRNDKRWILQIIPLFEYLIKNIHKDKKRLAATAQLYIAKGLYEIVKPYAISHKPLAIFAAGGMANNKIISQYFANQGVYVSKKIPRGDEGIAVGQIIYCLFEMYN